MTPGRTVILSGVGFACVGVLGVGLAWFARPRNAESASRPAQGAMDTSGAADSDSLPGLKDFPLDTLEPVVRRQISEGLRQVRANPNDASAVGRLGMLFHTYEIHRLAEPCYRRAVRLDPEDIRWRYYLGQVLARNGDNDGAAEQFDAVLARRPADVPALLRRAEVDLAGSRFDAALSTFERVIGLAPDVPQAYCGAGQALFKLGRCEEARGRLEHAVELAPKYGSARYTLAKTLRALGRLGEAADAFRLAEAQRDNVPASFDPLGHELEELATGAIEALHRGVDRLHESDAAGALPLLEQSLRLNPDLAETHAQLGTALVMMGELDRAAAHLHRALEIEPEYALAHYNLGLIAHRRGAYAAAVERFFAALRTNRDHFESHLGLGMDLSEVGRIADAEEHLRTAMRLSPTDPRPYKWLATLLTDRGDAAGAVDVLRRATVMIPDDLSLQSRLAWLLATDPDVGPEGAEEALRLSRFVCEKTEYRVARAVDALAASLAATGRFDEARAMATRARELAWAKGDDEHVNEMEQRIRLFGENRPYRLGGADAHRARDGHLRSADEPK